MSVFQLPTEDLFNIEPYSLILASIKEGKQNALSCSELAKKVGLDARAIRRTMEVIRRSGVVVCSCQSGYYFPLDIDELFQYIVQEERRIHSSYFTLKTAWQLWREWKKEAETNGA